MFWKVPQDLQFEICHYATLPPRGTLQNMGAQVHPFWYATASKLASECAPYTGFGAHKFTTIVHFLVPLAQIWVLLLLCEQLLEKFCTGAHLQYHSYTDNMNFIYRLLLNCWSHVQQLFGQILKIFQHFCWFQRKLWHYLVIQFKSAQIVGKCILFSKNTENCIKIDLQMAMLTLLNDQIT